MERLANEARVMIDMIDLVRDSIKRVVEEAGGFMMIDDELHTRTVLVNDQAEDWKQDEWNEEYVLALRVKDGVLQFFSESIFSSVYIQWTEEEIKFCEDDEEHWYTLDWDCCNSYQHNVERIAYYLTSEE